MNEESSAPGLDLRAVGMGALWGLVMLLIGAITQGTIGYSSPFSANTEALLGTMWQILGGLIGGLQAARRATGIGWLHGLLSGASMVLVLTLVSGVATAFPGPGELLKALSLVAGAGMAGGIAGVNLGRR